MRDSSKKPAADGTAGGLPKCVHLGGLNLSENTSGLNLLQALSEAARRGFCSHSDALELAYLSLPFPLRDEVQAIRALGIDPGEPVPLRVFAVDGLPHLLAPVIEGGQWIDVIAFRSRFNAPVRQLHGAAWALGADNLTSPLRLDPTPVTVFRHPMGWLKARGRGAVILDYALARARLPHLEGRHLEGEDAAHAADLRRELRPRQVRPPLVTYRVHRKRDAA